MHYICKYICFYGFPHNNMLLFCRCLSRCTSFVHANAFMIQSIIWKPLLNGRSFEKWITLKFFLNIYSKTKVIIFWFLNAWFWWMSYVSCFQRASWAIVILFIMLRLQELKFQHILIALYSYIHGMTLIN